jgi:hypothetical protein
MEDAKLLGKAKMMDIELDDLPRPPAEALDEIDALGPHYDLGTFGNRFFRAESRAALRRAIRERSPAFRKEQRERIDLWLKGGTIIIGLIGATTGLVAVLKK